MHHFIYIVLDSLACSAALNLMLKLAKTYCVGSVQWLRLSAVSSRGYVGSGGLVFGLLLFGCLLLCMFIGVRWSACMRSLRRCAFVLGLSAQFISVGVFACVLFRGFYSLRLRFAFLVVCIVACVLLPWMGLVPWVAWMGEGCDSSQRKHVGLPASTKSPQPPVICCCGGNDSWDSDSGGLSKGLI